MNPLGGQESTKNNFSMASDWGKQVMDDPELKDFYKTRAPTGINAYIAAIRDYLKSPVVSDINTTQYSGHPGDIITISADEDLMVVKVNVVIANKDGVILEEGTCTSDDSVTWHYTAKTLIEPSGCMITATAMDNPQNSGTLSLTIG